MFKNLQRAHLEKKPALQDFTKNPGWIDVGNINSHMFRIDLWEIGG